MDMHLAPYAVLVVFMLALLVQSHVQTQISRPPKDAQ